MIDLLRSNHIMILSQSLGFAFPAPPFSSLGYRALRRRLSLGLLGTCVGIGKRVKVDFRLLRSGAIEPYFHVVRNGLPTAEEKNRCAHGFDPRSSKRGRCSLQGSPVACVNHFERI